MVKTTYYNILDSLSYAFGEDWKTIKEEVLKLHLAGAIFIDDAKWADWRNNNNQYRRGSNSEREAMAGYLGLSTLAAMPYCTFCLIVDSFMSMYQANPNQVYGFTALH